MVERTVFLSTFIGGPLDGETWPEEIHTVDHQHLEWTEDGAILHVYHRGVLGMWLYDKAIVLEDE